MHDRAARSAHLEKMHGSDPRRAQGVVHGYVRPARIDSGVRGHAHFQAGRMARFGMRLAYKELRTLQGRCSKTVIAMHRTQHLGIIPSQGKQ